MKPSPEQRRTMLILGGAFILSILIHLVFLTALRNYHEPRTEERQEIQQVTLTTVVHLHTPTPPPIPTPTPPEPSPTPPPTPTPEPTVTPPPNTPKPATPKPQTPAPVKPKPIAHPQAAPKAAHLHLNVPKTNTVRTDAQTESHADTAPGTQNGTLSGHGITGGAPGTGPGGPGTGAVPAAPEEPVASCPHPNRLAGVDDPVEPEAPEGTEGISGIVRVEVTLTADGQIVDVKVGQSSGNPLLDKAALDASRRSKFHSIRKNCVDVPGTYLYRVEFAGVLMSLAQAIAIAILQGVSELFPVSSLGHAVIIPALLHWSIDRNDPTYLAFLVVLHLGTGIALMIFYRDAWAKIIRAFIAALVRGKLSDDPSERVAWLLIAGTLPVGLLGVFLEKPVRTLFGSTLIVASFLVINAFVMFAGEALRKRSVANSRNLASLSWMDAAKVGLAQSLALLPGISRSGCSIVAGLLLKLSHEDAARYSFLLATPVIFAAAVLEIPKLFAPEVHLALVNSLVGGLVAAVTAYVSVAFLTKYFKENDLRPFGWYCLALGSLTIVLTLTKVIV